MLDHASGMTSDAPTTNFSNVCVHPTPPSNDLAMTPTRIPKPHPPNQDVPEELEPGAPPIEPDEGPVPAFIPEDPEHERVIDPGENRTRLAQSTLRQIEVARCP